MRCRFRVGATENLILAALGCRGTLTLCNAAREPEIGDLIIFLRACGADIRGEGSLLRIRGGVPLTGACHTVLPDRMEAATYLAAAAATRGDVTLTNVRPEHLTAVLAVLEHAGCTLTQQNGMLRLRCSRLRAAGPIRTAPYDGFPTDAQAPLMAAMAVAEGVTVFEENLFEDRFRHVPALRALGAHIHAARRYAVVTGVRELHGASMTATDLRGGAAMVIGALCARGESELAGTAHLKRGYAELVPTLRACGADITER
ncbi:MAG: UDP-N-acetylglucosamine 1-carboxyvinyltransferase [Oscillospiraceae bacterium]